MDNVGIVIDDLDAAAVEFFTELGMQPDGRAQIKGRWADAPSDSMDCAARSR